MKLLSHISGMNASTIPVDRKSAAVNAGRDREPWSTNRIPAASTASSVGRDASRTMAARAGMDAVFVHSMYMSR